MCSLESFPFDYTKVDLTKLKESKNMVPLIFQKERDRIGGKRQTDRQTAASETSDYLTHFSGSLNQHVVVFGQGTLPNKESSQCDRAIWD